jgi:hypothetical protein
MHYQRLWGEPAVCHPEQNAAAFGAEAFFTHSVSRFRTLTTINMSIAIRVYFHQECDAALNEQVNAGPHSTSVRLITLLIL